MTSAPAKARAFIDTRLPAKSAANKAWLKDRLKWPTGFCNENGTPGQHEGTKPRDFRGVPMMTCGHYLTCPCACHKRVDEMFEMAGMERREVPNPEYVPELTKVVMPDVPVIDPLGGASIAVVPETVDAAERPSEPTWTPPTAPLAQRRTETGRAARGGLEAQVWDACTRFKSDPLDEEPITPKRVGEWIADKYKIPVPSSGAVNAVWDRWTKLEFCEQAKKPNRFVKFTGNPSWEELTRLKSSMKRHEKSTKSAARRGFR